MSPPQFSARDDVFSLLQYCDKLSRAMEDQVQGNQLIALILHRSKCRCLVLSYKQLCARIKHQIEEKMAASAPAPSNSSPPTDVEQEPLGVSKFLDTVKRFLGATSPSEKVQQQMSLIGPLKAFHQVAQEIERYVDSCRVKLWTKSDDRKRWLVEKALNIGLSSDILDLHLHDLLSSYFLVQQAFWGDFLEMTYLLEDIMCLNSIWLDHDDAADKNSFLSHLSDPFPESGSIDDFIVKKLSMSTQLETSIDNILPEFLWVDSKDLKTDVDNSVIGEGSFGVVSKAHWMGSVFAMKSFFHVEDLLQFGKEASLQARLRHPNVMHLLCCSMQREQKTCSLVMPLMWQDLRALMTIRMENGFNPPFPLPLAVEFMLQIAKGMEYLHSLHIMHRDLKSVNVLVSFPATSQDHQPMADKYSASFCLQENLPYLHLRIADFGVSKGKAASARYTTKVGTTAWMAPEVYEIGLQGQDANNAVADATVAQSAKYTKKADIYSFGMVCYEILTGNFPFEGYGIGKRVLRGERPSIQVGHSCPFALANFIEKCWSQVPLLRPNFTQICRMLRYLKACIMLHDHPLCKMTQFTLQSCSLSGAICDAVDERVKAVELSCEGLNPKQLQIPLEMFYCSMVVQEVVHNGQKEPKVHEAAPHINGQKEEKVHEGAPSTSIGAGLPGSYTSLGVFGSANTTLSSSTTSYVMTVDQYKTPEAKQAAREFSYEELVEATNNFEMEVGSNAKHIEYKGKLKSEESEIVVKKGRRGDEISAKELRIVRGLEHPNLMPLIGWCWQDAAGGAKLLHLVYKYMPNGNLSSNILCEDKVMEWEKRYRVVMQLASVLHYMHHGIDRRKITHGDVTACNVGLDSDWNAHLANYGISWELDEEDIIEAGYCAPELMKMPKGARVLTPESDVYGFGLTVLSVACGKGMLVSYRGRGLGRMRLRDWVWPLYEEDAILEAADERLAGQFDKLEMEHLLSLGLACSNRSRQARPSMDLVLNSFKKPLSSAGFGFTIEGGGFY